MTIYIYEIVDQFLFVIYVVSYILFVNVVKSVFACICVAMYIILFILSNNTLKICHLLFLQFYRKIRRA